MKRLALSIALLLSMTAAVAAQQLDLGAIGQADGTTIGYIIQMFGLLTVLSVAPGLLIMVTSFTRFVIAFSILRAGIGLQTTPANMILISLSLFMTFYVMAPTFDQAWSNGVRPLMDKQIDEVEAFQRISDPFRAFMVKNVRDKDFDLFADLAAERGETVVRDTVDLQGSRSRLHDLRNQAGFRDRLPDRVAFPGDRPDRRHHYHGDGHDDAAADRGVPALQDLVLRPYRRLEPACRQPCAFLQLSAKFFEIRIR